MKKTEQMMEEHKRIEYGGLEITRYSTRVIKRKQEAAMQRALAEPTSFSEARERGLNYYWDTDN